MTPLLAPLLSPGLCKYVHNNYDNSVLIQVEDTDDGNVRVHLSLEHGRGAYVVAEIPFGWFLEDRYGWMYREIDEAILSGRST